MTNQEAMRGRAREFLYNSENSPPTGLLIGRYEDSALTFAAAFALQEVASRDARIARLIRQRCALESRLQQISDVLKEHKIEREQESWEALKEQP